MKVLIALDGSRCSDVAFESVMQRRWLPSDQFYIVSVVELIIGQYPLALGYGEVMVEAQHELVERGKELVRTKKDLLQSKFPEIQIDAEVIEGFPADAILRVSQTWQADLIVLGSHGRKGINKFLLGSVAEKVASQASCSIEIIKQKQPDTDNTALSDQTNENASEKAKVKA